MNLKEYINKVIELKLYTNIKWFFSLFCTHDTEYEDEYMVIKDKVYYLKIESVLYSFNRPVIEPVLSIRDKIKLTKDELSNLHEDIETSLGILFINLIRLTDPFNGKIEYINKVFTDKDIEKRLPSMLKNKEVSIKEYLAYTDSASYILPLANIFTYSSTIKTITPPPNMKEEKLRITKEFDTKYGKDWVNDSNIAIEYSNKLKEVDNEYLKDDPAYGKMLSGKVTNNSRPRLYGAFGVEYGFDKTGKKFKFIQESLQEGYPKDTEKLAALFNSARAGSYGRGKETQQGGSLAKDMLRPTSSLKIVEGNCGTTRGKKTLVTKINHSRYNGSYLIKNGTTKIIENTEELIGQVITIRSPQYCIEEGDNFCQYCLNETMKNYKDGLPLLMIESGGILLNASMKGMHKASKKTMLFDITKVIR